MPSNEKHIGKIFDKQTWEITCKATVVKPVISGHPQGMAWWPLNNTGWVLKGTVSWWSVHCDMPKAESTCIFVFSVLQ